MKKFIDPFAINTYPVVVLSLDYIGIIPLIIRLVTRDNYNHIMESRMCGAFVSQNATYREVPFSKYMNRNHKLKFWAIKDMTDLEKLKWNACINRDLTQNVFFRLYDWLGVLGHLTGIRWLNLPYKSYCSERVAKHLREVFEFDIRKHPTPAEVNDYLKTEPRAEMIGYWDGDMEITGSINIDIGIEFEDEDDDIDEVII